MMTGKSAPGTPAVKAGRIDLPVVGLLLTAFAVRIAYLLEFRHSPLFRGLVLDELNYDRWAQRIASGDLLGHGAFTANPLGPYALGLLYALFGRDLMAARVVQMAVGTAACYFIYRLALHLLGRGPALITLALAAFYGPMIYTSGNLVAEGWSICFASASLMLLTHPRWTPVKQVVAACLFAVAGLGRPNIMLMAPLLPLAQNLSNPSLVGRERAQRGLLWLLGICLTLGPVFLRNVTRGGEPVLITAHSGVNLWIGNNPDADGFFKTPRGSGLAGGQETLITSSIRVAEKAVGHPLTASESSRWWRNRALEFMVGQPLDFLRLEGRKVAYYLNVYEKPLESNYYYGLEQSGTLRWGTIGFGLIGPLALAGIVIARKRIRQLAVLFMFLGVYSVSVILYFVSMRYRLPVVVVLLPFAGLALHEMTGQLRVGAWRVSVRQLAVLAAMMCLVHLPITAHEYDHDLAHNHFNLGNVAQEQGDREGALAHYLEAVRLYPEWSGFYNNLGLAYVKLNQPEKAVEALERGISLGAGDRRVYRNLAKAYRALGQPEPAIRAFRKALEASPRHVPTYVDLGTVLAQQGRAGEARQAYSRALELTSDSGRRRQIQARIEGLGTDSGAGAGGGERSSAGDEGTAPQTDSSGSEAEDPEGEP